MPGVWRRGVAAAVVVIGVAAGGANAQATAAVGPRSPASAVTAVPPPVAPTLPATPLPPAAAAAEPVRDLTPPNWPTDSLAPPGTHEAAGHVPSHLAPTAGHTEGGLFVTAEYLLLRARRGAFDFAINDPNRDLVTGGNVESLHYETRSGVRAGLGYRLPDTEWDALVGYTYYRTSTHREVNANPNGVLLPTLTRPGLVDEATNALASANFEYNVFDAEVGRRLAVDDHLALRLFGGLRFVTLRQDEDVQYNGLDARASEVHARNTFDGFGPVFGGEAVLAGWRGFHLYGKASGGLLTGRTRNPLLETNNAGQTTYVDVDFTTRKVVPVASVGVGGGWQYRQVSFRAGYEITNYFGLIDQPRVADDVSRGKVISRPADLSLEGLFLQVGLTF